MNTLMASPLPPRISYRPDEVAAMTGMSRRTVYRLVERGELAHFRVGSSVYITAEAVERWRADRLAEAAESA